MPRTASSPAAAARFSWPNSSQRNTGRQHEPDEGDDVRDREDRSVLVAVPAVGGHQRAPTAPVRSAACPASSPGSSTASCPAGSCGATTAASRSSRSPRSRPGHTLVVPIEEVDHWIDLDPTSPPTSCTVAQHIGRAQQAAFAPGRVGLIIAGMEVPHSHLHVVPIDREADLDFANADTARPRRARRGRRRLRAASSVSRPRPTPRSEDPARPISGAVLRPKTAPPGLDRAQPEAVASTGVEARVVVQSARSGRRRPTASTPSVAPCRRRCGRRGRATSTRRAARPAAAAATADARTRRPARDEVDGVDGGPRRPRPGRPSPRSCGRASWPTSSRRSRTAASDQERQEPTVDRPARRCAARGGRGRRRRRRRRRR